MPNPGDVLYVKNIEEPVTFIQERPFTDEDQKIFPIVTKSVYVVRRAIFSPENGVVVGHKFFDFLPIELETHSEQATRHLARIKERQAMAMSDMEPQDFSKLTRN